MANNDVLTLAPEGDLVASTVDRQREAMIGVLESAGGNVVLDLSSVEVIDSLGITLILGLFKSCQKRGVAFSIVGISADIMRVFNLFKLARFFPIREA